MVQERALKYAFSLLNNDTDLDQDAGGYARVSQTRGRTGIGKGTDGYQARLLQQGNST